MNGIAFAKKQRIVERLLGFQPLGVAVNGSMLVVADYFGPALLMGNIEVTDDEVRLINLNRVAGTLPRRDNARMFPNVLASMAVNRMQSVVIYNDRRLGITRNSDGEIYDIVLNADGAWEHVQDSGPRSRGVDDITSAVFTRDGLVTIEIDRQRNRDGKCYLRDYRGSAPNEREIPANRYGIAVRERDGAIITVSDSRADEHGLFVDDKLQVAEIVGNGVALINDGEDGALLTRYSHEVGGAQGEPGVLLYIPPELLK